MRNVDIEEGLRDDLASAEFLVAMADRAAIDAEMIGDHVAAILHRKTAIGARRKVRAATILLRAFEKAEDDPRETLEEAPRRGPQTIVERLENWSRYLRGGRTYETTITGIICESMRRWHMGDESNGITQSDVDDMDGELVHRCVLKLNGFQRQLLDLLYRWRMPPAIICRKMGIKPRPTSVFDLRRHNAEDELERHLNAVK